jgi:hypothetical protein
MNIQLSSDDKFNKSFINYVNNSYLQYAEIILMIIMCVIIFYMLFFKKSKNSRSYFLDGIKYPKKISDKWWYKRNY